MFCYSFFVKKKTWCCKTKSAQINPWKPHGKYSSQVLGDENILERYRFYIVIGFRWVQDNSAQNQLAQNQLGPSQLSPYKNLAQDNSAIGPKLGPRKLGPMKKFNRLIKHNYMCIYRQTDSQLFFIHRLRPSINCLPQKYQENQAPPKKIFWIFCNPKKYHHSVHLPQEKTLYT